MGERSWAWKTYLSQKIIGQWNKETVVGTKKQWSNERCFNSLNIKIKKETKLSWEQFKNCSE